jgi:ribosomal protein S18 acetylase RimI-like enzyme
VTPGDRPWISGLMAERWGADTVVVHGTVYRPAELSAFVAERLGERVGLITYRVVGQDCEIVTLDSLNAGLGIGTGLIEALKGAAQQAGCTRLWLVTTNDNLEALRFYQKRGFRLCALRAGAVDQARELKPQIPWVGACGIPIRDEIELELELGTG